METKDDGLGRVLGEFDEQFSPGYDHFYKNSRELVKTFLTHKVLEQARREGYEEGLSLREAYNDPKLLKKIKEKAIEEERERIRKELPQEKPHYNAEHHSISEIYQNNGFNMCLDQVKKIIKHP